MKRNKDIVKTKEEVVRQKVLDFLINEKGIDKVNIELEVNVPYILGEQQRGRADIVIYDENREPCIVIECKEHGIPNIDNAAVNQAKKYATKLKAKYIWVTNGDADLFFEKQKSAWKEVQTIEQLGTISPFPMSVNRPFKPIGEYLELLSKEQANEVVLELSEEHNKEKLDFILAIHQLIFKTDFKLPFSSQGVRILEDRGISYLKFGTKGGDFSGFYRVLLVATEGRVETVAVATQQYPHGDALLCVGFIKESRHHHALQLQLEDCDKTKDGWEIWHDRSMFQTSLETVSEAVIESGREDLINNEYDKPWVYLGDLPKRNNVTWTNSKKMLANLIHYALIRTELRDARKTTKK